MPHYVTNRGKLLLAQGLWNVGAAGDILLGLLVAASPGTVPTGIDTQAEINPLNFVSELVPTLATEASWGGYARTALSRTPAAEDDPNNRVNLDASDVTFNAAAVVSTFTHCYGGFLYQVGAADSSRPLISVATWTAVALNGSNLTVNIADAFRIS